MGKVKVGQVVKWQCKPFGREAFIAEGIVRAIGKSAFGGKRDIFVAIKIEPVGEYVKIFPKRKSTTIALYNII